MIAFDTDVLIYAADANNPNGQKVRDLLDKLVDTQQVKAVGSVMLLPELLSKPIRNQAKAEVDTLTDILSKLTLVPATETIALAAARIGADYRLRAQDATHLATAIHAGAKYFLTNNTKDFGNEIAEISVVHPTDIPSLLVEYNHTRK